MFTAIKDGISDKHCAWWRDDFGVPISVEANCPWACLAMVAGLAIDRMAWLNSLRIAAPRSL